MRSGEPVVAGHGADGTATLTARRDGAEKRRQPQLALGLEQTRRAAEREAEEVDHHAPRAQRDRPEDQPVLVRERHGELWVWREREADEDRRRDGEPRSEAEDHDLEEAHDPHRGDAVQRDAAGRKDPRLRGRRVGVHDVGDGGSADKAQPAPSEHALGVRLVVQQVEPSSQRDERRPYRDE